MTRTRASEEAGAALSLAGFLPYRLNVLASEVSHALARRYGERFGIAVPEWRVLATIGEFGALTAKAIGAHAHMGKVKTSRAVASLEGRGLVGRSSNPADLREAFLSLTPAGDVMYREIVPLARDYVKRLVADLTHGEAATLDRVIDTLLARARAMHDPAG